MGTAAAKSWSLVPARRFLRTCRRTLRRSKLADSTGVELTGAALLTRALILRRLLRRHVLADDEKCVGLLVPPSVAGVVANAALAIDRRVAVNLNYTVSSPVMNSCIAQAAIRHVLTSRKVMEKLNLQLDAELVYLEDFKDRVTGADKLVAAAETWLLPVVVLERILGLAKVGPQDLLTVIFTSGSTGEPKGVMLSGGNVAADVEAFNNVLRLDGHDVLIGILPFFHSFGYTVTMWTVMMLDPKGAYHVSPLEPRQVGALSRRQGGTILVATPTFLRSYLRRCEPEDFATLEVVVAGAEKLPGALADAFEEKFGVRPVEGYGATELSPAIACNVPPSRTVAGQELGSKDGTIGQPFPGISVKTVDLETGADLGVDKAGMLWVKGPVVMQGYLGQPEETAEVIRDGWYVTGDVAAIDAEGFIRITGRESRFSKIGGEMVPHVRIEESLMQVLDREGEELKLVVTAVPDPRKGERLVVLHTGIAEPPEQVCRRLGAAGLPPLWIPSPDSFRQVEDLPLLGSGKLDLKRVKRLAEEAFPAER
jgi:acyl-[acyl-carrier-protein]-phospholipid O-acyltransferase/long-chain-fatty-acid--[acyl-carrier-protein] ligase